MTATVGLCATLALAARSAAADDGPPLPLTPVPHAERLVGIAYQCWFPPIPWDNAWGTPALGQYRSSDHAVIEQHADWLVDAGVDFIWVDWSNNVDHDPALKGQPPALRDGKRFLAYRDDIAAIESATLEVFKVYAQRARRPRISIFLGCPGVCEAIDDGRLSRKADQVHDTFVSSPEHGPLVQTYLGKPLLVIYMGTPTPYQQGPPEWDDPRFTVRWMTGFITEQPALRTADLVSRHGYWSWEDRGDQTVAVHDGRPEAMVVVASHRKQGEPGTPHYVPELGRRGGSTLRERWARAREVGPKFAMVVSWNEWTRGEQPSAEVSKDIEPSEEHGRLYLDVLKEEIARFRGPSD